MNITRAISSSRLLSRGYATKHASKFPRPKPGTAERPAYHAPDPLVNNPKASVTTLKDENLTFIYRPPPSAASAHSYTTAPASPLLRGPPPMASEEPLPPLARPALHKPTPPRASDEVIAKIRELRAADPKKYSRGELGRMFNVTRSFVSMIAPVKIKTRKEIRRAVEEEHQEARSKWTERHSLVQAIRKKRREMW